MDAIYKALVSLGYQKAAIIVLLLGIFIDVNPGIKLNPIKAILKYIGKALNSDIKTEINSLKMDMGNRIDQLQAEQVAQKQAINQLNMEAKNSEVDNLQWQIIDFGLSITNGIKHSRSQYRHILSSFVSYKKLCEELSMTTDDSYLHVKEAGERIQEHYNKYKDTNIGYF